MMVLPFLMIMVLPKLINTADPETQRVRELLDWSDQKRWKWLLQHAVKLLIYPTVPFGPF